MLKEYTIDQIPYSHVYGRTVKGTPLPLFWTASGLELNLKASELWVEVEVGYGAYEPWLGVLCDGVLLSRQMLPAGRYWLPLLRTMDDSVSRDVVLLREVQAMCDDPESFLLLHAVRVDGEFLPVPEKTGNIEVIGDSLTSGEGLIGAKNEMTWNSMVFSSAATYEVLAAKALHADLRVLSQSGWGVLSSWDGDPCKTLPRYYDQICGLAAAGENGRRGAGQPNDFTAWQPDVVVVNLGTNDDSAFNQPAMYRDEDGTLFDQQLTSDGGFAAASRQRLQKAIIDFLYLLRRRNPEAQLYWVYGMLGNRLAPLLREAVETYRTESGDLRADFVLLPATTETTYGSREHAGAENHRQAARTLLPLLQKHLPGAKNLRISENMI